MLFEMCIMTLGFVSGFGLVQFTLLHLFRPLQAKGSQMDAGSVSNAPIHISFFLTLKSALHIVSLAKQIEQKRFFKL